MNPHLDDQPTQPRYINAWIYLTSVIAHVGAILVGSYFLARFIWRTP